MTAASRSTSRSAVSRRFKAATTKALDELMGRDLGELRVAAMMIDGVFFAGQCCVVALAICADGTKVPVGLWLGDTENKTVVTHLLADLSARGLDASGGILFVLDGSKALAAGVRKVFGDLALIQRCTLHKRRNVSDHLARDERPFLDRKLARAFNNPDPDAGLRAATELARLLEDHHPDAAASLREGLDDMFTVRRLGLSERLCRTLTNTNTIDDLRREDDDAEREALAGRQDDQAVGRRRDAQRRAQLPSRQGRQGHAHPARRPRPPHRQAQRGGRRRHRADRVASPRTVTEFHPEHLGAALGNLS